MRSDQSDYDTIDNQMKHGTKVAWFKLKWSDVSLSTKSKNRRLSWTNRPPSFWEHFFYLQGRYAPSFPRFNILRGTTEGITLQFQDLVSKSDIVPGHSTIATVKTKV